MIEFIKFWWYWNVEQEYKYQHFTFKILCVILFIPVCIYLFLSKKSYESKRFWDAYKEYKENKI